MVGRSIRVNSPELVTDEPKIFYSGVIGQEPKVADAMKAGWQDVDEKAADKLAGGELHCFIALIGLGTVVSPLEGDTAFIATDEPTIGDGHAMGIPREIGQHGLWTRERSLGIDDPFHLS